MLVADGCGGQNKNTTVVGMVCTWLVQNAPPTINKLILLFPIVGHSYIPPDRIFGRIEKEIRKKATIVNPEEYEAVFHKVGTVFRLGTDVEVRDWKTAVVGLPKKGDIPAVPGTAKLPGQWHFQFMPTKKIIFTKTGGTVKVQGEIGYNVAIGAPLSICKRGKSWRDTSPKLIQKGVLVKEEKLKDLKSLLQKHYGIEWEKEETHRFYQQLLQTQEVLRSREEGVDDAGEDSDGDDAGEIPLESSDSLLI